MEEKLRRESKSYLDKLFKRHEHKNTGALSREGMRQVMREMFPEFNQDDELDEVMVKHLKVSSYTVLNKDTGNFDVRQVDDTLDFPSAQFIVVYFLRKLARRDTDPFSGKGLVRFNDFGQGLSKSLIDPNVELKRRMY
jgi:hypothetical protein